MKGGSVFEIWWLMYGSKFDEKLGVIGATKKELAEYAFKAGMRATKMVEGATDE